MKLKPKQASASLAMAACLAFSGIVTSCGQKKDDASRMASIQVGELADQDYDNFKLSMNRVDGQSEFKKELSFNKGVGTVEEKLEVGTYKFIIDYFKADKVVLSSSYCSEDQQKSQTHALVAGTNQVRIVICGQNQKPVNPEADVVIEPTLDAVAQGQCPIFPADSAWNTDVSKLPVHPNSGAFIKSIGEQKGIKADFGSGTYEGAPMGIPYVLVPANQPKVPVTFTEWPEESDPGPYPIPMNAPVEGTMPGHKPSDEGDHHVIAVDIHNCRLYEIFKASPVQGGWTGYNGAVFDLRSATVPARVGDYASKMGWTSGDAAGLPIFPGLVRYDEVKKGEINHALRFTVSRSQKAFVFPASHWASHDTNPNLPPMGLRLRLKSNVDISGFSRDNQVILRALQKYGMIVADNGSDWYISGAPHDDRPSRKDFKIFRYVKEYPILSGMFLVGEAIERVRALAGLRFTPSAIGGRQTSHEWPSAKYAPSFFWGLAKRICL